MKSFYLSMLFAILLLSGCGSSSSSNKVAQLVDGPVEGISYSCNYIDGLTDYDGSFEYQDGCKVSFHIGGITLGEILATDINTTDNKVFISEVLGLDRNNISSPQLIQLLQILQSLDENNDPSDGILISLQTRTDLAGTTLDLSTGTVTTAQISAALNAIGITLVSEGTALAYYMTMLNTELGLTFDVPTLSSFSATLAENSTAGTAVGSITITSTGGSPITAITLSGTGAADFTAATDGTLTIVNPPDYETLPNYNLTAVATNLSGDSASVNVTITVTNSNEFAPVLAVSSATVVENTAASTVIGAVTITSTGDSPITAITLIGTGAADFTAATDGTLTVVYPPDYETLPNYNLTAVASNAAGESAPVAVTINIADVADIVPTLTAFSATVVENTAASTVVGAVTITSTGDSPITAITLSGTGAADFTAATDGTLTIVNPPDYETLPNYNLTAVASNAAGESAPVAVTINIADIADIVPTLTAFSTTIVENMAVGSTIGSITITDAGDSVITAITLGGSGSGDFSVSADGTLTIANTLDYAKQAAYSLNAVATNTAGDSLAVYVTITITPTPTIEADKLLAGDAQAGDEFGNAVAISGDYMVVGAWLADQVGATDAGSAYIYKKNSTGGYSQIAKLTAGTPEAFDLFGISVAIDGNYVVVGAQLDNGILDINDSGSAYVFKNDGSDNYSLVAELNALDPEIDDHFGWSVDISGPYVVVAADNKANHAGRVYVFKNDGTDHFTQVAKLAASDASAGDYLGYSVAISGNYVIAGAFFEDPFGAANAGSAYIFKNNGTDSYTQIDKLNALDPEDYDHFGRSVGINGDYVVVGAYSEDPDGAVDAGSVYLFKNDGADSYNQVAKLSAPDAVAGDEFGRSVGISGSYVVIGAHYSDPMGFDSAGSAYIFKNDGTDSFIQTAKLVASDTDTGNRFGTSVSINGFNVIVGAPGEDPSGTSNAGSSYLFTITP